MSLKDPKKIHENEEFAIFKGKDGHELKILKNSLSDKLKKELSALPLHAEEGGQIMSYKDQKEPSLFDQAVEPFRESGPMSHPKFESEGARSAIRANEELVKDAALKIVGGKEGWRRASDVKPEEKKDTSQALSKGPMSKEPEPAEETLVERVYEPGPPEQAQDVQPVPVAPTAQRAPSTTVAPKAKTPEEAAISYKAAADDEAAKTFQDLLSGKIQPKTYQKLVDEKGGGVLGKIGLIFGMMLSGAGSGLTGQPNILLQMMDKEIDRDLEAQKKSVEGAQNLYQLNIQKQLADANMTKAQAEAAGIWKDIQLKSVELSKNQFQLMALHHVMTTANMLPQKDRAGAAPIVSGLQDAVTGDIDRRNSRAAEQEGLRAAGYLGLVPGAQNIAAERDARYVPGVGQAEIPVSEGARKELGAHQALEDAGKALLDYSKKHTNLIPGTPEYNAGLVKAEAFRQTLREGLLGTVYRDSEDGLLKKFMDSNPAGAFKMLTTQPKLRSLLEVNTIGSTALKKQYGLPTKKASQGSEEIKIWNGKKYKRGKNGEAVEVK